MQNEQLQQAIERIENMQRCFDALQKAAEQDKTALLADGKAKELFRELIEYYESGLWLSDYELDEKGLIPSGIKRGILSQDAVYDLLREIKAKNDVTLRLL